MIHSWQQYSQSKICLWLACYSRSQSTPTRAPSNKPQSSTNESSLRAIQKRRASTSALSYKQTFGPFIAMSALPPKADIDECSVNVR
jgi:nitrate/nitrite transporter NarK